MCSLWKTFCATMRSMMRTPQSSSSGMGWSVPIFQGMTSTGAGASAPSS
eukprot:CAMPEP_0179195962 /NCGR_PEP_ID=MMETSP0796-20121207/97423_1 /TAXON_ID=73915 /ORGANISM="Pyrodinium bahamense, Strain pbaha01" /LENGTH=48 /DNA_ID= /DNA_START= /DNA_END= /DNA_ORIENTATION=